MAVNPMLQDEDEEIPPYDPKKVAVFVILLLMIAFAGWRFLRAQAAVAAVADASKDYRKLFPARAEEPPAPAPVVPAAAAPASGMMLQVDDDMRAPKPVPAQAVAVAPAPPPEAAPAAKSEAPAPAKPAPKAFHQPRLNAGGISGLNGGGGIGYSGRSMSPGVAEPARPSSGTR